MTSRDRVLATLAHEQPDRVPLIIGTSNTTGIKMGAYRRLKAHLGIGAADRYIYDWPELGTAAMDEETLRRLGGDARGVLDRFPAAVYRRNQQRPPHAPFIDDWGTGQVEIAPGSWFPGVHPLKDAKTIDAIERYPWPDMDDPTRIAHVRAEVARLRADNEFAVIGTPWLLFPFERACAMQGMDTFLLHMALSPDVARALLARISDLCTRLMGHFLDACGDLIDIVKIGDDLGSQDRLLMSPTMYRDLLKPFHAAFIAFIRQRTKAKIFFHTDGDVFDLVEDLVEIGVDILNPVQTSAGRMSNLPELKRRFGSRLTFCGAVDTHRVLPTGTPEEVREEVRRVVEVMAPGGGYMVASVHTIMDDVPPENIVAMAEAVAATGRT